ncbi:MAG: FHA domain-containing protein [Deltaproteobacteria bacterium]|jgi:pSer/pThr/pTyr-binding forkhead associated (FHA) protein/ribosomal protein L40E|nr:FHA domain-containing protein [Deltaproteobacteria bacterium]
MDLGLVCDNCDALNDVKADVCTSCGQGLREPAPSAPSPQPEAAAAITCPKCNTELPQGFRFCGNCGHKLTDEEMAPASAEAGLRTQFFGAMQTPNRAKLILIKGEGLDGTSYVLNSTEHVAGREEGEILFPEDPMLSPQHACFYYEDSELVVRDEGSANGVFVRITYPFALISESRFLVGEQLLQFEPCTDETTKPPADREGTYFYSSPRRPSRFKLVQVLRGGEIGMIYRAPTDSVTLGREGNDINFPDAPYISGHHARVSVTPDGFELLDLGSKNGTFFRIEKPHRLSHGDYLFIGQQLLRVEIT